MKIPLIFLASVILLVACGNYKEEVSTTSTATVDDDIFISPDETVSFKIKDDEEAIVPIEKTLHVKDSSEATSTPKIPETFLNRDFIIGGSASSYNLFLLPGNIIEYDSVSNKYNLVTVNPIVKDIKAIKIQPLDDGVLYRDIMNREQSLNFTLLKNGVSLEKNQRFEYIIQDVAISNIENQAVDESQLQRIKSKLSASRLKNMFFIQNATLTLINHRILTETKFNAKVDYSYVTIDRRTYGSNERFSRERLVSVELVSLEKLIVRIPNAQ